VNELRRRGYVAHDADDDGLTSPRADGAWGWRSDLVRALLDEPNDNGLFFAGCSDEQTEFEFEVLLTAPLEVILERLRTRTTNSFGKAQVERDRVLSDMEWVVPLLRDAVDLVVDTTAPTSEVADVVIDAVVSHSRGAHFQWSARCGVAPVRTKAGSGQPTTRYGASLLRAERVLPAPGVAVRRRSRGCRRSWRGRSAPSPRGSRSR
jgi:hypothetical protein